MYSVLNFLGNISETDKNLIIYDINKEVKWVINPFTIRNVIRNNNILRVSLNSGKDIILNFSSSNEATEAIVKLQLNIDALKDTIPQYIDKKISKYLESFDIIFTEGEGLDSTVRINNNNFASGRYSVITGGFGNTASGTFSSILGGQNNNTNNYPCAMILGSNITAISECTTHVNNIAIMNSPTNDDTVSDILVRDSNGMIKTRDASSISAGVVIFEQDSGTNSTVRINNNNCASGDCSTVGGGSYNDAIGNNSTIGGGSGNCATGTFSSIGGGCYNCASGYYSNVSGGRNNCASGYSSTVGGGYANCASGYYSTIGGGRCNFASGNCSTVGGGCNNCASGFSSTIGGGRNNCASGNCSTIGGGVGNCATGTFSSILGGQYNNTNNYPCAMILGSNITADRTCTTFVNNLSIMNIATSSSGLPSGSVWNDLGTLKIVC